MNARMVVGLLGAALLFIGVFMPILSAPMVGDMNYFRNGEGDGVFVLVLAAISFLLVVTRLYPWLWLTAGASLALMAFSFYNVQSRMSKMKADMATEMEGNPFRGLADMVMQSVQLQWGWAVMIVGAVLLIVAAVIQDQPA